MPTTNTTEQPHPTLPFRHQDPIYTSLTRRIIHSPCAICHLVTSHYMRMHVSEQGRAMEVRGVIPCFKMQGCGHLFHEMCLYAYLCEPEVKDHICGTCASVKWRVGVERWDAGKVRDAVDRIGK